VGTETTVGYMDTEDSRDEIHEVHSRRNKDILEEINADTVGKLLARNKQKLYNYVSRMMYMRYPKTMP
jgi:hypothetical protein